MEITNILDFIILMSVVFIYFQNMEILFELHMGGVQKHGNNQYTGLYTKK